MTVIVDNAYPQYDVHIDAYLKNAGTVPIHICPNFYLDFQDITDGIPGDPLEFKMDTQGFNGSAHYYNGWIMDWGEDGTHGTADDFAILIFNFTLWIANPDMQVHPCEENLTEIDISFTQEAEECHTYKFTVKMIGIQWNKDYECDDIFQ
jgi:hypothetical protein